jgi:Cd2+/Zn2+-exporting ATPase
MDARNPTLTRGATLELDIPLLLPDAPDAADTCTARLLAELTGREGLPWVHVLGADGDQPAKLCIHYDPDALSLGRIKEIAEAAGA